MFSDPSKDFQDEESQKILLRISSTPISQLQADDYIIIFQEFCPPGTVAETLPYIPPLFKFIKRELFRESFSSMMTIWENFASWMLNNINEIEKLRYKSTIDHEIDNLFLYLVECGCGADGKSLYGVADRISGIIGPYVCIIAPIKDRNNYLISTINCFQKSVLLKKMIMLCLCLTARRWEKDLGFIFEIFNKQEIQFALNEIVGAVLEWDSIPSDLDEFIVDCEEYLTCES